ncbi:probable acyl-[acyl-carrier-protein]--UDP-N-acetylglucosamine O-acyltransferase, mitochondrial [Juglans microcarpa x Juglans regia]|uniref:probable acyl-[acyl-carrier-protein]--UDP-N-acetylglucosamine O-acyltransferase, mitochondrial n=1 Tax=Juglans microcarpa x Juglans regia TaxID=2249226 RepID=UPI001B7DCA23|nr:probable acyl-[acyl-carrier-protein]--UDP-N-acetylglucosamine O-acyltransferase, mitochondrial [Juglans microcarpa x Juglans regia]
MQGRLDGLGPEQRGDEAAATVFREVLGHRPGYARGLGEMVIPESSRQHDKLQMQQYMSEIEKHKKDSEQYKKDAEAYKMTWCLNVDDGMWLATQCRKKGSENYRLMMQGVSIGPLCTFGSSARLGNGCELYPGSHISGNSELGERCILMTGAVVGDDFPGHTVIGCNNIIGHHAVVGIKCQDLKYKSGDECFLDIGDNNDIREHTSIHRSSMSGDRTVIGDNNLIMGSCHIAHDCKIGNNNIFANNTLLAGHVVVEDYVHTAGAIVVHQFCSVGSFSFIGGGSVVMIISSL